jgi:C_GCAxxG_C_C family probable redox protein
VLAVGEHLLGKVDAQVRRMATGLGGGVGNTHQEMCGALSGGVLLIGALYGRTGADEDDSRCMQLASRYREEFVRAMGTTRCGELRADQCGSSGTPLCATLAERAAVILLEVLADAQNNMRG